MKTFGFCTLAAGLVFSIALGVQMQLGSSGGRGTTAAVLTPPRLPFPAGLAPAAQASPVPASAEFAPGDKDHKLVFMKPNGELHEWHERIPDEARAYSVEDAELVVVVGRQKKAHVDTITYANNAPPIERHQFDVEVSVVAPKTGTVLANRVFRHMPRPVRPVEAWETTLIGRPVEWAFVYRWVASRTRTGFPAEPETTPLVRQVD